MRTLSLLAVDDPRWAAFVGDHPAASPFHHPVWAKLLADCYRFRCFVAALDDGTSIHAGMPMIEVRDLRRRRSWIGLPFTDSCRVLATDDDARLALLNGLTDPELRAPRMEIREHVDLPGWLGVPRGVRHVLPLGDIGDVRSGYTNNVRRNLRRAERDGVRVKEGQGRDDMRTFYALHVCTRHRQGVPVQPWRFFDLIWSRLVATGLATIVLADVDEATVAAALFLHWNGTTVYKFGASDAAAWSRRPNHPVLDHAIEAACARRDRSFDFGRSDFDGDGLRSFKGSWGADELPLDYATAGAASVAPSKASSSGALGTLITRSPAWVCRGLGAAFYRYAASR
jgi:hypothetical protein